MTIRESLRSEFEQEMTSTRTILEYVPDDKFDWSPHEKSSTLGRLVNHLALIPGLVAVVLSGRAAGKGGPNLEERNIGSVRQERCRGTGSTRECERGVTGQDIRVTPTLEKPLLAVLRGRVMNHLIHHRGQLSVYLRLLDVKVPGMYGPSADERA